jgi:hypothetical protein
MIGASGALMQSGSAQALTNAGRAGFNGMTTLSLEPKMMLVEMDNYLHFLQQLRRTNEGDDTKDSPGYALDLVRVPVSVLPGRKTREGYGAEITVTATPYLTPELLPTTFRGMTTNDLVDVLAPLVTQWINDPAIQAECKNWAKSDNGATETTKKGSPGGPSAKPGHTILETRTEIQRRAEIQRRVGRALTARPMSLPRASGTKSRRAYMPIPPSQVMDVFGADMLGRIVCEACQALAGNPANQPQVGYLDVRNFLAEEINAAYFFLGQRACETPPFQEQAYFPGQVTPCLVPQYHGEMPPGPLASPICVDAPQPFWTEVFCSRDLADAIRGRNIQHVRSLRARYLNCIATLRPDTAEPCPLCPNDPDCNEADEQTTFPCKTLTAALGWGLLVEASLLNEQLNQDFYEALIAKGMLSPDVPRQCIAFYGPNPPQGARRAFIDYVQCRWPVRVFALDPMADMQNVEDSYSRHRQLQIALAMGFASGKMNAQSMMKFARQLDWDMQAVALNQTAIGFSHGDDTFGWRFYPRYQTPPNQGNAAAFWQSLAGGPTTDQDMRRRLLEPMMRECVAIVIMPSFVPYVTFDTRTRFFKLTNAEHGEISMKQTLELSRSIKAMQSSAAQCSACAGCYRDGEVDRLLRRVDQLDKTLPLQTMRVMLPFENTSGGFELFNRGVTDLSPELIGWYGAPGIDAYGTTTLFLIGRSFSVNGMQVIVGGRAIGSYSMLSRQVLQVTIPPGSQFVIDDAGNKLVDVHAATAYGVTDHLLVPIAPTGATIRPAGPELSLVAMQGMALTYTATAGASGSANTFTFQGYQAPHPYVEIVLPQAASPLLNQTLNVNLYLEANGVVVGMQSGVNFVYSAQTGKYGATLDAILPPTPGGSPAAGKGTIGDATQNYLKNAFGVGNLPSGPLGFHITAQVVPTGTGTLLLPVMGHLDLQLKP